MPNGNGIDQLLLPAIQFERSIAQAVRQPVAAAGLALPELPPGPATATRDLAAGRFPMIPGLQVPAGLPRPPAWPQFALPAGLPGLPGIMANGNGNGNEVTVAAAPFTRARVGTEPINGTRPITASGFATSM
ncbi:MAG: hypothetical protein Q8R28_07985 [Dehalococcoidia bacterium]|nr:hypothetical protein [Dehalococcoidia bacterium]